MRTPILFGTLALALSLTACGDDTGGSGSGSGGGSSSTGDTTASTTAASTGSGTAAVNEVDCAAATIAAEVATDGFAFEPATITIAPGGVIRFTPDVATHNMEAVDGSWGSDLGATACFEFPTAGTYDFQCVNHKPSMAGTVTVQ